MNKDLLNELMHLSNEQIEAMDYTTSRKTLIQIPNLHTELALEYINASEERQQEIFKQIDKLRFINKCLFRKLGYVALSKHL